MVGFVFWPHPQWTKGDGDQNDDNNNIGDNHLLYLLFTRLPAYYTMLYMFI